jgi:hypothetical protein
MPKRARTAASSIEAPPDISTLPGIGQGPEACVAHRRRAICRSRLHRRRTHGPNW